jgi:hypothetical protein
VPIICICNDKYNQKLRSLRNHCLELEFRRPTKEQVAKRVLDIARREGLAMNEVRARRGGGGGWCGVARAGLARLCPGGGEGLPAAGRRGAAGAAAERPRPPPACHLLPRCTPARTPRHQPCNAAAAAPRAPQATCHALVESSNGDIRLILGSLQMVRLRSAALTYEDVRGRLGSSKDSDMSPFEWVAGGLGGRGWEGGRGLAGGGCWGWLGVGAGGGWGCGAKLGRCWGCAAPGTLCCWLACAAAPGSSSRACGPRSELTRLASRWHTPARPLAGARAGCWRRAATGCR